MKRYVDDGNNWIITESNSDNADVYFYRFFGNKEELKQKLFKMSVEHRKDDKELVSCPYSKKDIEENIDTGALFCMVSFEKYDLVITAKDVKKMNWKRNITS